MNAPRDMLISVIVSTYNRPDALERVLSGCGAQSDTRYEIIVADDGSAKATRETVARCASSSAVRIEHVWHPDDGFRLAEIRNKGIAQARGDYLIFLDGDCVPQRDFVQRHRQLASERAIVTGSRILLDETLTKQVIDRRISLQDQGFGFWAKQRLAGHVNKIAPLFVKLPDRKWRDVEQFKWRGIKGCNMSAWRSDLERVNGFDTSFVGWGHEDADLVVRLANGGVHRKLGAYATEIFHLWHREQPRTQASPNQERVKARIGDGTVRAERGLAELAQ
ncbi:glycosyltransferase family 2 protein [Paraburkholderia lycopersici]|uniref:N-terminal domain of galactosyltransferase n=1 Tax=Paraburkholderia lycopersici TaxID=416944 RepID=A0A1G6RZK0_9BURK|nr:glycosyltransferase family 2 protein [Paraburkholderia lycopersici]SDD09998.1 N-terminal domain of galactosyltransferase [Paraburkholderia lycopersici]